MIIVSGWLAVDPEVRNTYLRSCVSVVEQARSSSGCLDFAVSADLVDAGRINVYERWESEEALDAFRSSGPDDEQTSMIRDAEVLRYQISGSGPP
ncbi:putative quinol monooxygenase [Planobispora longispora]|uniref:Antibiotic biosynthesis monooxygenase n=1 Tax=Planobispora longispora TaxID=28887 RepID=A0A8J3RMB9_9ACTN|nr:antibiotic biosynthesis monooxygenase family protein [Planobispora longispora]BFE87302.1 antibiotic biosynthesis monooxygenase [Planobispora longispora]GIH74893.1 antibiotic biosynthesis monooxygenase [Planobispora longispora]